MTLGATLDWGNDMGWLISKQQLDTVVAHVDAAKGAACSPAARPAGPRAVLYEPTILEGVTPEMTCFGDETSGRSLALPLPRRGRRDRPSGARRKYGLDAAIFSQDGDRARAIARLVKCGTVNINEAFGATSEHRLADGQPAVRMGRRQGSEMHRYTSPSRSRPSG